MAHRYFMTARLGEQAIIEGQDAVHLRKVVRVQVGEEVILCDDTGYDHLARVETIAEDSITCTILSSEKNPANPSKHLVIYMALPKQDKLEFVVQKACELGASKLVPFVSEFCVAQKSKRDENKRQRLQKIAGEAAKQCGRSTALFVERIFTFAEVLADLPQQETNLFFYEHATLALKDLSLERVQSAGILIGSEGGFSEKECQALLEAGVPALSLGKRILRCETAAVTALSLVGFLLGELDI